jgi:hypothetical protein
MKRHIMTLAVGVLAGAIVAGGAAVAITSNTFTYSSAKTGHLALSPMAFAPDAVGSTAPNDYLNDWNDGSLNSPDGSRCFNAGVNLPNGAKIKSLRVYYSTTNEPDFHGSLFRQNPATGTVTQLAHVDGVDESGQRATGADAVPTTKQIVRNDTFEYGVGVCATVDALFFGARITYTYRSAGD